MFVCFFFPFPPTHGDVFLVVLLQVPFITPFTSAYQFFTLHANLRLPRGHCWCNQRWASQFCAQKWGPHPSTRRDLRVLEALWHHVPCSCLGRDSDTDCKIV
jgi:hypothetical protein